MTDKEKTELLLDVLVNFLDSYQTITADIEVAIQKAGRYTDEEIRLMVIETYEIYNSKFEDIPSE